MRVLRDPTLSSYHHKVVGSLMYILKVVLPSLLSTLVSLILWQSIVTSVYDGPILFAEVVQCFMMTYMQFLV
jgi:TRAP-type C4-dicarboxylate transport system permease small subunit